MTPEAHATPVTPRPIEGARVRLVSMPLPVLEALIARDAAGLHRLTDATFAEPVEAPPLMGDALPVFRDALSEHPEHDGWWSWLIVDRATRAAVGSVGLAGPPDDDGVVLIGYAVYPAFQGQGYASEAVGALLARVFDRDAVGYRVHAVRATIPPDHAASIRVAEKCGFVRIGTAHDDDVGPVLVFETTRAAP
jgi:[ribosomal protein S5]-alanine N-acetyltransferase